MRSAENIEKLVKNLDLDFDTNPETNRAILDELLEAQKNSKQTKPALSSSKTKNTIMKSSMTKLAVAAGVILAVVIGIRMPGGSTQENVEQIVKQEGAAETVEGPQVEEEFHGELNEVRQMAAIGDVKGLTTILSEGKLESKLVAANFLTKMGKMS